MPPHQEDLHFYFTDRLRPVKLPRDFTGDDVIGSDVIEGDVIGGMLSEEACHRSEVIGSSCHSEEGDSPPRDRTKR